jgi:LysM repeat protein
VRFKSYDIQSCVTANEVDELNSDHYKQTVNCIVTRNIPLLPRSNFTMAEGAKFPWKMQKLHHVPTVSYKNLRKPLRPPSGKRWAFDSCTKEWSLEDIPKTVVGCNTELVVDAVLVDENGHAIAEEGEEASSGASTWDKSPYFEHIVQQTDTFEGLCLRYKITPTELRQANGFTGNNLFLAPNPLKIPNTNKIMYTNAEARSLTTAEGLPLALTSDQVVRLLLKDCPELSSNEAKAYLELNDWELSNALQNARDDGF